MKNNYPIKYAAMPIENNNGEPLAYIVSKCYVISEEKKYSPDGDIKYNYNVVFPYQSCGNFYPADYGCWKRVDPDINNTSKVTYVFDDYSGALSFASIKNANILQNKKKFISIKDFEAVENSHQLILDHYGDLQKKIDDNTFDLRIKGGYMPFIQSVSVDPVSKKLNNFGQFSNLSLYSCLDCLYSNNAFVYSLSNSDFQSINNIIHGGTKDFSTYDEFKQRFLPNYDDSKYLLFYDNETGIIEIANPNENIVSGSYYLKNNKMYYDETMIPHSHSLNFDKDVTTIIYTREKYEDILKSYLPKLDSYDEINIGGKVLKKKLREKEWY